MTAETAKTRRLRVLATSDLHMHLNGFDYHADRPDPTRGLTRIATLIAAARTEAAGRGAAVLLVDNGDGLQGTPMGDLAASRPRAPHPLMRSFAQLGYDALGLGNHDFDFGPDILATLLAQAPCPVIGSNLDIAEPGLLGAIRPFAILEPAWPGSPGRRLRIGVLSLLPPQTARWNAAHLAGRIAVGDILAAARRRLSDLHAAGCELVLALAHSGIGPDIGRPGMENAVIPLAALDGIDVIVAGHTHQRLPGPDHDDRAAVDARAGTVLGKPVVMPGAAGADLGVIDLDLAWVDGRWRIRNAETGLRPVRGRSPGGGTAGPVPEAPALACLIGGDHDATRAEMALPAGHSAAALHSYFSLVAPDRALALVAAAQAATLRPHLAGTAADGLPLVSATAPARSGGRAGATAYTDVPAGPLLRRHVFDLCPFPNLIAAAVVTGAVLRDWLERSASLFARVPAGSHGTDLVDPDFPAHDFDVLYGLTCRIDLSMPPRFRADGSQRPGDNRRIRNLCHEGQAVGDRDLFAVALNSYRAAGGGHVAALDKAVAVAVPPLPLRDALTDYLSGLLPADPLAAAPPPWSFVPMPGTIVSFRTGAGANSHLGDLTDRGATAEPDLDDDGFLRLSLKL